MQNNRKGTTRMLLLLATKNADKAAAPAAFEHRLAMMCRLADNLRRAVKTGGRMEGAGSDMLLQEGESRDSLIGETIHEDGSGDQELVVDVGVTKEAIFAAKARAIDESGAYALSDNKESGGLPQVNLIGFDTLTRLVDAKYYENSSLDSLKEILENNRGVRVTLREPPPKAEQLRFLTELEGGNWEAKGWKKKWLRNVEVVEGRDEQVGQNYQSQMLSCFTLSDRLCSKAGIIHESTGVSRGNQIKKISSSNSMVFAKCSRLYYERGALPGETCRRQGCLTPLRPAEA